MKILDYSLLFTKTDPKSVHNSLWANILTLHMRATHVPPPTLLRYKFDTSPMILRRIGSEVDRRKCGQDTVENGRNIPVE